MRDPSGAPVARRGAQRPARNEAMAAEVWAGLSRPQKELSPKYFYDARGSALFDEITRLPEYYPTRTERALLRSWAPSWVRSFHPRSLVELGAGSADKTRILLDAMRTAGAWYVPVDISTAYLEVATRLGEDYPLLRVLPAESDITARLDVPADLPRPVLFAFLGSTIGNFEAAAAVPLLRRVAAAMTDDDRFLMGADLKKDITVLERAYNDARGVTAEFNRNILRVLNRETGADFRVDQYDHLAYYDQVHERIEMHLVARERQLVRIPGKGTITVAAGESMRTEISCKYDRERVTELFDAAGLSLEQWTTDGGGLYALAVGRRP
jgi:L-histidine N-alpha-methyltransferase